MYALGRSMRFPALTLWEIAQCYSFRSHRSGGDGWWALACCDKQEGKSLITKLPSSNKEWKKSWFMAAGVGEKTPSSVAVSRVFVRCSISEVVVEVNFLGGAFKDGAGARIEGMVRFIVDEAY
ncbi:hypothetical protein LWI28_005727 [Acer negundo]|uniref:Uncharacterized protein n=1 Tax=Acer negundo TaxID=4023 RepID=A0AAD5IYU4_ACENE|nr:hypothetical protein LWI28_005727 [Acer negundo]